MKTTIKEKLDHMLEDLRGLSDEVRLNLHLAGMEAKDAWRRLEHEIEETNQRSAKATEKVSEELATSVKELVAKVRSFQDRIADSSKKASPPSE